MKAKLDLEKFLSGGRAAREAVDDAIAAHGRERGGVPKPAPERLRADELATLEQLARDAGTGLEVVRGPVLLELVRTYRLFHATLEVMTERDAAGPELATCACGARFQPNDGIGGDRCSSCAEKGSSRS